MIHHFGFVLGTDTARNLRSASGIPNALEGVFDFVGHGIPIGSRLIASSHEVVDVVVVEVEQIRVAPSTVDGGWFAIRKSPRLASGA
jgi:hypothetical protein